MNAQNENIRFPRDTFSLDLLFADSFTIHSCSLSANKTWRVMEACKSGITFISEDGFSDSYLRETGGMTSVVSAVPGL